MENYLDFSISPFNPNISHSLIVVSSSLCNARFLKTQQQKILYVI